MCGLLDSQIQQAVVQTQAAWTPVPTATSYPTLTPYPTFTPLPTATPISSKKMGDEVVGARWKVKVTKAETANTFETWSFPAGSTNHMVVVTVEYVYLGSESINFYPEGVILADATTKTGGWSRTPRLYKNGSTDTLDFSTVSTFLTLKSGNSYTDTFIYEFPIEYKNFVFYFPETLPIELQVK